MRFKKANCGGGFTLIELLIVVAIIAILAAIAVPNFLEVQTRAKISRVRNDMRTVVTGLELYRVDHGRMPPATNEEGLPVSSADPDEWFETKTPVMLTTPVAYLSRCPPDIFARKTPDGREALHYSSSEYLEEAGRTGAEHILSEFYAQLQGQPPPQPVLYFLLSFGPDQDHDIEGSHGHEGEGEHGGEHEHGEAAVYDASNGTVSNGDIYYIGPSPGFL